MQVLPPPVTVVCGCQRSCLHHLMTPWACSHALVRESSSCSSVWGYNRASTGRCTTLAHLGQGMTGRPAGLHA